ncbi:hypothetical protein ACOSQ2_001201 [Xanthoceras sorbifolium]
MSSCTATTTFYLLLLAMVATAGCTRESEMALRECAGLYEMSESRLAELLVGGDNYTVDDARAWLSGVLAYHSACLDGLEETGFDKSHAGAQNLSVLVGEALSLYAKHRGLCSRRPSGVPRRPRSNPNGGILTSWNQRITRQTLNLRENVEIQHHMKNLMFVGDGVWGDSFWARDMTFVNTVGPHQAVALRVASDLSIIYRLRPMDHQANMITAQGRDHPESNTGISIIGSRIRSTSDFFLVKGSFKTYLGRPWKKYSRTVLILKTDLDGIIHPKGWTEWKGSFAHSTLYYAEYLNKGVGALTANRVKWNGFHVLNNAEEASPFTVSRFIHGENWIPETGVPFSLEI